jgi:hypothetical protein
MKTLQAGLAILSKYDPDAAICAEHDCIYVQVSDETLTLADKTALDELGGWHWSEDADCWAMFT